MAAAGLLVVLRCARVTTWIVRVNVDLFDRETGTWERRGTSLVVVAAGVVLAALGAYYGLRGAAALPS